MNRTDATATADQPVSGGAVTAGTGRGVPSNASTFTLYALGMLAALVPLALLQGSSYWTDILVYTYLFAGAASAWNIIGGFGGQLSLGHGVFFAAGAYVTAILFTEFGILPWLTLPLAALLAMVLSVIFWPTFRLKGPFFAIATMAFNEVARVMVTYFDGVTGGPRGILVPFQKGFANMIFTERWQYALLTFAYMALAVLVAVLVRRSRLGYYLLAVREDEDAARASGVDVAAVKAKGMAVSAALTAFAGSLFIMYVRYVDPDTVFILPEVGVKFALLSLIGGLGTIAGPVVGAFLVIPVEHLLQGKLSSLWTGAHWVVFGLLLVLAALFLRHGIVGALGKLWARLARRKGS